jgi:hypothetical protein
MFAGLLGHHHLERFSSICLSWNTDLDLREHPGVSVPFRDGIVAVRLLEETRAVTKIARNKRHAMTDLILPSWFIANIFRGQLFDVNARIEEESAPALNIARINFQMRSIEITWESYCIDGLLIFL